MESVGLSKYFYEVYRSFLSSFSYLHRSSNLIHNFTAFQKLIDLCLLVLLVLFRQVWSERKKRTWGERVEMIHMMIDFID
jgi:hypothetical protein